MRAIQPWVLKLSAGLLTALSAAGSTAYVAGHLKSASAPLHPAVASGQVGILGHFGLGATASTQGSNQPPGHLVLTPSVESNGGLQPITITSVS